MSHIGQRRMFLVLYMQRLLLTKQTLFKALRVPFGFKADNIYMVRSGSLQMVSDDPRPWCGGLFGLVRSVCLFDPAIPWDTIRTLCLHEGVFVMSHIGQGRMFLALYMQRLLLTKQTRFKALRTPFEFKVDNIYMIRSGSLQQQF